ncbi:hypothetical protein Ccrd_001845 [Cynara cardunculus var. scolymus]|uniref:Myc-type, basic helix-loop-helix (BHLH) domain-containing protein n=1 Tax=Cynara cardunculus var. scolymus TaxID=59895 RepID=A0A118JWT9_CYNCS|nr:hypothetical protein Ccrd_001845 [Cynara cardunculus var. scolymus]
MRMEYSINGELMKVKSSSGLKSAGKRRSSSSKRVVRKVKKLQKLIPGGKGMNADRLFVHTANYIMHLKLQVDVLQALSHVYPS